MTCFRRGLGVMLTLCAGAVVAQPTAPVDPAVAFGTRPNVISARLSPNGQQLSYISGTKGAGSALISVTLGSDAKPRVGMVTDGKLGRMSHCDWASDSRLVCLVYGVTPGNPPLPFTRQIAVDPDGTNPRVLSTESNSYTRGFALGGGSIIDWLPDANGSVLMSLMTLPDDHTGTRTGSKDEGLRIDRVDTRTGQGRVVEPPNRKAEEYFSDGNGVVRVMGLYTTDGAGQDVTAVSRYLYRRKGHREWEELSTYNSSTREGFWPRAVDSDLDVAYGYKELNGLRAVYSMSLDGSNRQELVYANDTADIKSLYRIGRRERVVGAAYSLDYSHVHYFDPAFDKLMAGLHRALPGVTLGIVDSSIDEQRILVIASSDKDAGVYYLMDRKAHELKTLFVTRPQLEGVPLATVKPISFRAGDGTSIPGYLTLPPGRESAKGLPAIVMPHGGPEYRDEWNFDWLVQYFAARGYAVLQPNFRGSFGYGEQWLRENGFKSWRIAIGDVLDAGRWLVSEGIADPKKIAAVGWSYGGYASLQSAVVDPAFFKAVVAIAPVTDLEELKNERLHWTDYALRKEYVGEGPHVKEGSPAQNADKIRVPVLLFHGTEDINVDYREATLMDARLTAAKVPHELVTFKGLDHALDDTDARVQMLRKADAFLTEAFAK